MDTIEDDLEARIASQIRSEREARNWSLGDLAAKSGVAKASISKIERVEMSPSAVILLRLATAFGLTLGTLLLKAEGDKGQLFRAADQPTWRDPATGYVRKQIFSHSSLPIEVAQIELPPGAKVTLPISSYGAIRQVLWMQSGVLTLTEGGTRHVLKKGDCLGFGPPSEVTFANESGTPCNYVIALARS